MDSSKINLQVLCSYEVPKVVEWYNQKDKSWLYCDCPLDLDYSCVYANINRQLHTTFNDLTYPGNVIYYSVTHDSRQIGFAIFRKDFDYFNNVSGYSIGLDIPEKNYRYNGLGTVIIRKLLHNLLIYKNKGLNKIYLETLSYNKPMQKVAEKIGFELIEQRELEEEYQHGFANHVDEIASCLDTTVEELGNEKVKAMLYKIDFDNWPSVK